MKTVFVQCKNPNCALRFPVPELQINNLLCPRCKTDIHIVPTKATVEGEKSIDKPQLKRTVSLLLDNIRSTYNVGSIFRTADGAGIRKIY